MSKPVNIGDRFGRLTAVRYLGQQPKRQGLFWECRCDCGIVKAIAVGSLRHGYSTSCGCKVRDRAQTLTLTHGKSRTLAYNSWSAMMNRCYEPRNKRYARYGGRGIQVCGRWRVFENFLLDMGERPVGLTLERKNNDGNYEPGNCIWATKTEQARNRRTSRVVEFNGVSRSLAAWAEITGIRYHVLSDRIGKMGWPVERALTEPSRDLAGDDRLDRGQASRLA